MVMVSLVNLPPLVLFMVPNLAMNSEDLVSKLETRKSGAAPAITAFSRLGAPRKQGTAPWASLA